MPSLGVGDSSPPSKVPSAHESSIRSAYSRRAQSACSLRKIAFDTAGDANFSGLAGRNVTDLIFLIGHPFRTLIQISTRWRLAGAAGGPLLRRSAPARDLADRPPDAHSNFALRNPRRGHAHHGTFLVSTPADQHLFPRRASRDARRASFVRRYHVQKFHFAGKNVPTFSKHYPATVRGVVYLDRQI